MTESLSDRSRAPELRRPTLMRLVFAAVVAFACLATIAGPVNPAGASATGTSYFGNLGNIKGMPIYKGNYLVTLNGARTNVNYVRGTFSSAGLICNSNITAEFFDAKGRWYKTYSAPVALGCRRTHQQVINIGKRMQPGRMCSTLKTNGSRITSVCHNIY